MYLYVCEQDSHQMILKAGILGIFNIKYKYVSFHANSPRASQFMSWISKKKNNWTMWSPMAQVILWLYYYTMYYMNTKKA